MKPHPTIWYSRYMRNTYVEQGTATNANHESLLTTYDELLAYYVGLLEQTEVNPYQSPIVLFLKGFNPRFQLKVWKLLFTRDLRYSPNVLKQELIGAADMLVRLKTLSPPMLESIIIINQLNLKRLQNRSALSWFNKLAIGIGGFWGLVAALQTATGLNIWLIIPPFSKDLLVQLFIGMVIGGVINIFIILPNLRLVRVFDDILKIAKARQAS